MNQDVWQQILAVEPQLLQWRHHIHENPELSFEEHDTQAYIIAALKEIHGVDDIRPMTKTGVVALIHGEQPGKVLGLRADIDALPSQEMVDLPFKSKRPGVMHACGHDTHITSVLGAAKILAQNREKIHGTVKLIFQPAEERIGGAKLMIADGVLENPHVDAVIGLHCKPAIPAGTLGFQKGISCAAADSLVINVYGKQGHGAHPDQCVDSIYIAANIICAIQGLISREMEPLDAAVITFGKIQAGTASNIIAGETRIDGTLRTLKQEVWNHMSEGIRRIADGVAKSFRGSATVEITRGAPSLVENSDLVDEYRRAAETMIPGVKFQEYTVPSMGGDDFAFFSQKVPAMMFSFGTAVAGLPYEPLHSARFCVDENALKYGVGGLTAMALDFLK